jgi:hypothetical protein
LRSKLNFQNRRPSSAAATEVVTSATVPKSEGVMAFDTLSYARRLKAAGMPEAQAEAVAEATLDLIASDAATKADIAELKLELEKLRSHVDALGLRLTIRLGALIGVGTLAALIKL